MQNFQASNPFLRTFQGPENEKNFEDFQGRAATPEDLTETIHYTRQLHKTVG